MLMSIYTCKYIYYFYIYLYTGLRYTMKEVQKYHPSRIYKRLRISLVVISFKIYTTRDRQECRTQPSIIVIC